MKGKMKKIYRFAILLGALACFLVVTGLHKRLNDPYIYGPTAGLLLGFLAGSPKRGIISGVIWWLLIPVFIGVLQKESIDLQVIGKHLAGQMPLAVIVISLAVVGGIICRLTSNLKE